LRRVRMMLIELALSAVAIVVSGDFSIFKLRERS
jgi:hypothetical protein